MRKSVDDVKSGKYLPLYGSVSLFVVIATTLWGSIRVLETELDLVQVRVALVEQAFGEGKVARTASFERHVMEHRREREGMDRIRNFIETMYGEDLGKMAD